MTKKAPRRLPVGKSWKVIEAWLGEHYRGENKLPPGASESQIKKAEKKLGVQFPPDVVASYRLHDGSGSFSIVSCGGYPGNEWYDGAPLLSLDAMVGLWTVIQKSIRSGEFARDDDEEDGDFVPKPRGPIQKAWFHRAWIPLVDNEQSHICFLDFAPLKGGKRGQIIHHTREFGPRKVVASGLAELLSSLSAAMSRGKLAMTETGEIIFASNRQ